MAGLPTSIMRQVRPSIVVPHLAASFQTDTLNCFKQAIAQSNNIPNLEEVTFLIANTRCSERGLNLPLNYEKIAH